MIDWLKQHGLKAMAIAMFGAISFLAGQIFPSFFDYASVQRASITSMLGDIRQSGNAVEAAIPEVMEVASTDGKFAQPIKSMNDKLLELFQALDTVLEEFPEVAPEREQYVASLIRLREVASRVRGPLDAPQFIEAASQFRDARLKYEARVADLEPSFLESIVRGLR